MIALRPYQQRALDMLYEWMYEHTGNPCLVLPTGAGKSVIIAELCRNALQTWSDTRILMITHKKELIEQNYEKLLTVWPNAPAGIYSASVGRRQLGYPITFAGIQSVHKKADLLGRIDLCIVDEAHCIGHKDEGTYRKLINNLMQINADMRVIGLTASPYRLGHGLITDKPAIFDDLLEPVSILNLIEQGYLATLRSKITELTYDMSEVHKRGGEYIESELQKAVDTNDQNVKVVNEVIRRAEDRQHWLFFCTGVQHAFHIAEELQKRGITASAVHGGMTKAEREYVLSEFKAGRIKAVTSCEVLTTGFDYPDIDLIAMLRPTLSATLYIQMCGRGMRPKSHTDHCLVLDFAGVIRQHGPIIAVEPPKKAGKGTGDAPVKACPECGELVHLSLMECPTCHYVFERKEKTFSLDAEADIMGSTTVRTMQIDRWRWTVQTSARTGIEMLVCVYEPFWLDEPPLKEYLLVKHGGTAGQRAMRKIYDIAAVNGLRLNECRSLLDMAKLLNSAPAPYEVQYIKNPGEKFPNIIRRIWSEATQEA